MADGQQNEQDKNLKDILGFDPNATTDEPKRPAPSFKDERRGFPDNWKEVFKQSVKNYHSLGNEEIITEDLDNLFSVSKNPMFNAVTRCFYRYSQKGRHFEGSSYAFLPDNPEEESQRLSFITNSDNDDFVDISFQKEKRWAPITIQKSSGKRRVVAMYSERGDIQGFEFGQFEMIPNNITGHIAYGAYDEDHGWHYGAISPRDEDLLKLDLEEDKEHDMVIVRRTEDGEVKDVIEFPMKIDPQALKDKWLDPRLLEDPKNPDPSLDLSWKGRDFFHDAGLRWDAVADDSLHSLTRISPPAEG